MGTESLLIVDSFKQVICWLFLWVYIIDQGKVFVTYTLQSKNNSVVYVMNGIMPLSFFVVVCNNISDEVGRLLPIVSEFCYGPVLWFIDRKIYLSCFSSYCLRIEIKSKKEHKNIKWCQMYKWKYQWIPAEKPTHYLHNLLLKILMYLILYCMQTWTPAHNPTTKLTETISLNVAMMR